MKRIKIDFKENRSINSHSNISISAMEWLNVWNADKIYFDDERKYGYGGYTYDGRWQAIVTE